MAVSYYSLPDQFAGQTLRDLRRTNSSPWRSDVVANMLGISEDTPLQKGQNFGIDLSDPGSAEGQFIRSSFGAGKSPTEQMFDKQKSEEQGFLNKFSTALPAITGRLESELNLPNLRQSAFNLTETLKKIPQVQTQATTGYDVTENQRQRKIAAEQAKIAPLAQEATSQAQFAEAEYGRRFSNELRPFELEASMLSDRLAREFSGYTQDKQNELSIYLAKLDQGFQLSVAEQNRAHELALAESDFERQKELYSFKLAEDQKYKNKGAGSVSPYSYLPNGQSRSPLMTIFEQSMG